MIHLCCGGPVFFRIFFSKLKEQHNNVSAKGIDVQTSSIIVFHALHVYSMSLLGPILSAYFRYVL